MTRIVSLVCGFLLAFAVMSGAFEFGRADAGSDYVISSAEPVKFAKEALVAQADTGSAATAPPDAGSASAHVADTTVPAAAAPTPTKPPPAAPSVDQVTKMWRGGAIVNAGILTLYLLLTLAAKVDKKHAFYIAAGLAGIGMLVDTITNGVSPTLSMYVSAIGTMTAIMVRGPEKPKQ